MGAANKWDASNVPDMTGKRVFITGANSGIGFEAARVIAGKGGEVILACRSADKANEAMKKITDEFPAAFLGFFELDLADLSSIQKACDTFLKNYDSLDLLINNAGVMWLPQRETADGFEMQIGTNHFGHYALTGRLLPVLLKTPNARIVTVSSLAHTGGTMNFDDIHHRKNYKKHKVYCQSKLANLLFAYELQRKLEKMDCNCISVAVHPGISSTNLATPGFDMTGSNILSAFTKVLFPLITQKAERGCLPTLFAAIDSGVNGGDYFGPDGFNQFWGCPKLVRSNRRSHNVEDAQRLWEISEELTQVVYP